jgi:hypothetical protein
VFKGKELIAPHPGKPLAAVSPQGHRVVGPGNAAITPGAKALRPRPQFSLPIESDLQNKLILDFGTLTGKK